MILQNFYASKSIFSVSNQFGVGGGVKVGEMDYENLCIVFMCPPKY